jgi:chromosomal replication initiator protein
MGAPVESSHAVVTWSDILEQVRNRVSAQKFQTWFEPVRVLSFSPEKAVLEVPNPFFGDWFKEHNIPIIQEVCRQLCCQPPEIHVAVNDSYYEHSRNLLSTPAAPPRTLLPPVEERWTHNLYPRFVFDYFVVGKGNEFAHAAAQAVAKEPGGVYNPLFIYGGTGLGKTHLMQAVGHGVLAQNQQAKVYYASSEKFMNGMIQAITAGRTLDFRKKYRNLDLLLLDDIHFLSGRDATQEEFFHTFNALHDAHKQIIVTSDRPPKDIPRIEERLVSRFNSGLVTDIQPPDLETRVAILRANAAREGLSVPEDVLFLIAERIQRNIRELEGCFVRLSALSRLVRAPITADLALEVLRVYVRPDDTVIAIDQIQRQVARSFEVSVESLRGKRRTSSIAFARQVAMYLAKQLTALTLVEIGKNFGNRDHSTVLYAIDKIAVARKTLPELSQRIEGIENELKGLGGRAAT